MVRPVELSYSSLALAVLAPTLAPTLACGPGEFTSLQFQIDHVAYDGLDTLTLTFSEPIANAELIDPNDFRISVAQSYDWVYGDGQRYQGTLYADPGYASYASGGRLSFASASLGAQDNVLVLEMATPLGTYVCDIIAYYGSDYADYIEQYYPGSSFEMGMFLHYARGDIPVESDDGDTLDDIGPQWVLEPSDYMIVPRYGFVNLDPKLEIPCP